MSTPGFIEREFLLVPLDHDFDEDFNDEDFDEVDFDHKDFDE